MAAGKYGTPAVDQANSRATFLTDAEGNPLSSITITGTVNGGGQATVNVAGGLLTATVNLGSIGTINVGNTVTVGALTATVNLGSIGTINVGNTLTIGTVPTVNVGNTVNVLGTATVNVGSIPTVNLGTIPTVNLGTNITATVNVGSIPTVNLGSIPTVNLGTVITATVNIGAIPTVNIGSSFPTFNVGNTVNLGSIGTVNVGSAPTINVGNALIGTATVNVGSAIPTGSNPIGQTYGRAASTNPTAAADAAAVQYMLDVLGRTIVSRAPAALTESTSTILTSSANTQLIAGSSTFKHYLGTIGATMLISMAGPTTLRIKDGGPSGAQIWAWTFSGAAPNMAPLVFDPVYANVTASFQITADLSASSGGLLVMTSGFKGP